MISIKRRHIVLVFIPCWGDSVHAFTRPNWQGNIKSFLNNKASNLNRGCAVQDSFLLLINVLSLAQIVKFKNSVKIFVLKKFGSILRSFITVDFLSSLTFYELGERVLNSDLLVDRRGLVWRKRSGKTLSVLRRVFSTVGSCSVLVTNLELFFIKNNWDDFSALFNFRFFMFSQGRFWLECKRTFICLLLKIHDFLCFNHWSFTSL